MDEELLKIQELRKELELERNGIKRGRMEGNDENGLIIEDAMECVVKSWLKHTVRLSQYVDNFLLNGFDDISVIKDTMNISDLDEIGIKKLGHKKKIMMHIDKLKSNNNHDTVEDPHTF